MSPIADRLDLKLLHRILRRGYGVRFLDRLSAIPGCRVFMYGGTTRDIAIPRAWNDIDIRISIPRPISEREHLIEQALVKEGSILDTRSHLERNFSVYRFLPHGAGESRPLDLSIVRDVRLSRPSLSVNAVFVDLVTGEIIDEYAGLHDIENALLRSVVEPRAEVRERPELIWRTIKYACQLDFAIDEGLLEAMTRQSSLGLGVLEYIGRHRDFWREALLNVVFRGLQYDPGKYLDLLGRTNLLSVTIEFVGRELGMSSPERIEYESGTPARVFPHAADFERNVSLFLAYLASHFKGEDPARVFARLLSLFDFDATSYDNFEIDLSKVRYAPWR